VLCAARPLPESNISCIHIYYIGLSAYEKQYIEWRRYEAQWVRQMTVYGESSARLYLESSKNAPRFAFCPIYDGGFPNRQNFGTIFTWVQAEHNRNSSTGEVTWKEGLRQYAIAKVIKGDTTDITWN